MDAILPRLSYNLLNQANKYILTVLLDLLLQLILLCPGDKSGGDGIHFWQII